MQIENKYNRYDLTSGQKETTANITIEFKDWFFTRQIRGGFWVITATKRS
jgi:hypothetical protein